MRHGSQDYPGSHHKKAYWLSEDALHAVLKYGEIFLWRVVILLGWMALISGGAVYGGACRASYGVGCSLLISLSQI